MILPVNFLWSQLNGPQITAFTKAIFDYWKTVFDTKLDYFNNISVDTANDNHLTLLGLLSGLVRPNVSQADKDYFWFTENAEHNNPHGFSSLDNPSVGGRFSKIGEGQSYINVSLDESYYRTLLKAWISSEGEIGSLVLLDEICYLLTKLDLGAGTEPFYKFKFMSGDNIPAGRAPGDLYIDIGNLDNWHNPLPIYSVLRGVADSVYSPVPQLFISIETASRVATPVATPGGGTYDSAQTVVLSTETEGATIYYTVDGTRPTKDSTEYTGPITITQDTILRAIGIAEDFGNSDIMTESYIIGG